MFYSNTDSTFVKFILKRKQNQKIFIGGPNEILAVESFLSGFELVTSTLSGNSFKVFRLSAERSNQAELWALPIIGSSSGGIIDVVFY